MRKTAFILGVCVIVALIGARTASGAGFEVAEKGVRGLGSAYAGQAASGEDASTVWFNPAAMRKITGFQVVAGAQLLSAYGDWKDRGSTGWGLDKAGLTPVPLSGDDGGDPGGLTFLPHLYFVAPVTAEFTAGFGINVPFGLKTEYDDGWQGRYQALKSELEVVNFMLTGAYQVQEWVSIGGGVDLMYAKAELSNAIDFGTVAISKMGAGAIAAGFVPQMLDGKAVVEADGNWGIGYHLGILLEPSDDWRIGVTFHSKVYIKLEGDATFTVPTAAAPLQASGAFTNSDASARVTLPEQVSLSLYHDIDDQWTILGDVTWTNWARFRELRIKFDNAAQPDAVTEEDWNSVFRYSVGAIYRMDRTWTFRAGAAYDTSPIPRSNRTARIPTNDRIWLTFGVGYQFDDNIAIDASYMHVFIADGNLSDTASSGQNLKGTFEGGADVFGISLTVDF